MLIKIKLNNLINLTEQCNKFIWPLYLLDAAGWPREFTPPPLYNTLQLHGRMMEKYFLNVSFESIPVFDKLYRYCKKTNLLESTLFTSIFRSYL